MRYIKIYMQLKYYAKEVKYMEEKVKLLSPKIDIVFQGLFGEVGNENITKGFLQEILEEEIKEIDLSKNPILRRETVKGKMGILDVIAQINGKERCSVEMQVVTKENIKERVLYYWSRLYNSSIQKGQDYEELEKAIVILIADFKIKGLEELKCHSKWRIMEKESKIILTDRLEIDIIELPKLEEKGIENDKLKYWLYFIENPEDERVKEKMKENKELKEAKDKLQAMSEDEYMQRMADLREKAIMDEKEVYRTGYHEGLELGEARGKELGEISGKKLGEASRTKEIAKKMKEENIPIETIAKVTGLTEEEIENLK